MLSAVDIQRPNMAQEKALWAIALNHFGQSALEQVVREIWRAFGPPARPVAEILDISSLGPVVLKILQTVQAELGATIPYRTPDPNQIILYSRHARYLAVNLLDRLPATQLTRDLRGFMLDVDLRL